MSSKKILYIDMDGVIVDFESGVNKLSEIDKINFIDRYDEIPKIFKSMEPMPYAIEAIKQLSKYYNIFVLSTAPWDNPSAWSDKIRWIKKYFGNSENNILYKKLILTHHKNLNNGNILIDDRTKNGADKFLGELIIFGSEDYPDWNAILKYLIKI